MQARGGLSNKNTDDRKEKLKKQTASKQVSVGTSDNGLAENGFL
jgi:hypothetical protein